MDESHISVLESNDIEDRARELLTEAEIKAWRSLAQGKHSQFGYWAAKVVQLRELLGKSHEPSPFSELVKLAKNTISEKYNEEGR